MHAFIVEAVFPMTDTELEELVNFDKFESVSYYLTGLEYIIKYLLKHRVKLEQDGSPVPYRILMLVARFRVFLRSSLWKTQRSRQGVVVWALRYSRLPGLIKQLKYEKHIPEIVGDEMLRVLREAIIVLERGYLHASSANAEQMATQGARLALSLVRASLESCEWESQESGHDALLVSKKCKLAILRGDIYSNSTSSVSIRPSAKACRNPGTNRR